jgi:hypothetical protein
VASLLQEESVRAERIAMALPSGNKRFMEDSILPVVRHRRAATRSILSRVTAPSNWLIARAQAKIGRENSNTFGTCRRMQSFQSQPAVTSGQIT